MLTFSEVACSGGAGLIIPLIGGSNVRKTGTFQPRWHRVQSRGVCVWEPATDCPRQRLSGFYLTRFLYIVDLPAKRQFEFQSQTITVNDLYPRSLTRVMMYIMSLSLLAAMLTRKNPASQNGQKMTEYLIMPTGRKIWS